MSVGEVVAVITAAGGALSGVAAAYARLASKIEKTKCEADLKIAQANAGLVAEQAKFIQTTLEREERCREENHELRNEIMTTQARLLVVERSEIMAKAHLEVRGKIDQLLEHLGVAAVVEHTPELEVIAGA